jgi:hypothetical protein
MRETPERLKALEGMAAWCRERQIDPRHWLQSLFASRRWIFAPQWNQLTSEKHLKKKYPKSIASKPYQEMVTAEWQSGQAVRGKLFDVNRDLSPVTEAIKARYLWKNEADRCFARIQDETFGFHPLSLACARCPKAGDCERVLRSLAQFDIVALRRGSITMEQAAQQERQRHYERH